MNQKLLILAAVCGLMIACTPKYPPLPPKIATNDHASIKLAEAASSVSESMAELARIEEATKKVPPKNLVDPEHAGTNAIATLVWSGPVGEAVEELAKKINYRVRVLGTPPAVPVIVTINKELVPIGVLLRDIDYQSGHKAKVTVYPRQRVIELRYAKA